MQKMPSSAFSPFRARTPHSRLPITAPGQNAAPVAVKHHPRDRLLVLEGLDGFVLTYRPLCGEYASLYRSQRWMGAVALPLQFT